MAEACEQVRGGLSRAVPVEPLRSLDDFKVSALALFVSNFGSRGPVDALLASDKFVGVRGDITNCGRVTIWEVLKLEPRVNGFVELLLVASIDLPLIERQIVVPRSTQTIGVNGLSLPVNDAVRIETQVTSVGLTCTIGWDLILEDDLTAQPSRLDHLGACGIENIRRSGCCLYPLIGSILPVSALMLRHISSWTLLNLKLGGLDARV